MLNWWLGKAAEGGHGGDEDTNVDVPETPAPIFAARAIKSAIFGTPAIQGNETICGVEGVEEDDMPRKDLTGAQLKSLSPTKPPGILLTPGTATARRKTVSFGAEVLDKQEKDLVGGGGNSSPRNCPGMFPSPWSAKSDLAARPSRKTSLTRSLEQARETRSRPIKVGETSEKQPLLDLEIELGKQRTALLNSQTSNEELMQEMIHRSELDGDVTVDLNEPRSQSGRFWKSEYENYHEEARNQMQKLVKYKTLAKSFAKMKDSQAIELAEQLKEEQRRVVSMEDKMSKLSAQIAANGLNGMDDQAPEMITELAKRTALAVRYRGEVEEFRAALEGDEQESQGSAPRLNHSMDHSIEIRSLRDELEKLRQSLVTAEKANDELHQDNQKLEQELEVVSRRYEKHIQKCKRRQNSIDESRQKKEEAYQKLQGDYERLKESAKSQRRDAENLLKQRHEQVVGLKKELAANRSFESTVGELQQTLRTKINEHERIVADFQKQLAQLKQDVKHNQNFHKDELVPPQTGIRDKRPRARTNPRSQSSPFRDSLIPIPCQPTVGVTKTAASATSSSKTTRNSVAPRPVSFDTALMEITNNASSDFLPQRPLGPVQHTPDAVRLINTSVDSPCLALPSPKPSLSYIVSHERRSQPSPRPSMFCIASSPPKPTVLQNQPTDEGAARRQENVASSGLSGMDGSRFKNPLPPDRAAAAKARLEQKMAEKKKTQGVGKENVRSRVV